MIDRSAIVRNSIIGVEPHSPIIRLALEKLRERWDAIGKEYPGEDVQSIKKRVTLRSFAPFHESVLEAIEDPEFKGIIFPAGCFNEIERSYGLFAKEDMVGAWYTEPMTHHEEYLNNRLHKLMKRMHLFMAGVCVLMVLSLGAKPLYRYCVKQARKTSSYQPCAVVEGEKPFVIVIPSYNNARYVDRNLQSVFAQEYTNYRVVYIDDASSDGTHEKALAYPVTLIRNAENQKALANLYQVIHGLRDEEIVVLLDGDDWLFHTKVLQTLNRYYQDSKVWLTYGQYITYPQGEKGISREPLTRWRTRSEGWFGKETDWCFSHLRTFYAGLFKKIKRSDLEYQGEFFSSAWDLAMLFPMVEMAGDHAVYVPDILYVYNQETTLSDGKVHKEEQLFFNRYIRSLPVYPRIRDGLGIHP